MQNSRVFIDNGWAEKAASQYRARRKALAEKRGVPVVLVGVAKEVDAYFPWTMSTSFLIQDPTFLYYTGINQTGAVFLLDPTGSVYTEYLFLPAKNPHREFWDGFRLGCGDPESEREALNLTGADTIEDNKRWASRVVSILKAKNQSQVSMPWFQSDAGQKQIQRDAFWYGKNQLQASAKNQFPNLSITNCQVEVNQQKTCLDTSDIAHLRTAIDITGNALGQLLKHISSCQTENMAKAILESEIQKQSYFGQSFASIVAGGANAAILHYTANNAPLDKNGLLLLDFGAKWQLMNADISRTIPVSKKYSPLQKRLIEIVLESQDQVESMLKAGVTITELNRVCWAFIEKEIEARVLKKAGKLSRAYKMQPHNVSHLLGVLVHDGDPFRSYRNQPLEPGMVITNEPGIYGTFDVTIDGIRYHESLGIRIEDNLLVTQSGCENLSRHIPKAVNDIEALCA